MRDAGTIAALFKACQVEGCEKNSHRGRFCSMHYERLRKRGDVGGIAPEKGPPRCGTPSGYASGCRCDDCRTANTDYLREYKKTHPETPAQRRQYNLKKRFGITPEQYDAILIEQGGRCAICRTDDPQNKWGTFCVDHDHDTDDIRGLLCFRCNAGMGLLGDDINGLKRAIAYLERPHA